jgi:hypothetical protein
VALGLIATGVIVGDDIQPVTVELFRSARQVASVLEPRLIPDLSQQGCSLPKIPLPITVLAKWWRDVAENAATVSTA